MDHYSVLGVSKTATPDEIKKAYRKLASQHHPDKGGDKAKFQEIQSAYDVLGDPNKRRQYDNPQPQGFHGSGVQWNVNGMDINDIFQQMFTQPGARRPQRQIFRTQIMVSLQEAYSGINKLLELNTPTGKKVIDIKVPAGVNPGDQMRYDNILDSGSLLVEFVVLPDLKFERRKNDLYCNQRINVLDLIVGSSFEFTTISGKTVEVKVPEKTQPYMQMKLAGYGMPIVNTNQYGDQYILLKTYIPDTIDQEIIDSILRNRSK